MEPHKKKMTRIAIDSELDFQDVIKFIREKVLKSANDNKDDPSFPIEIFQELHKMGWLYAFLPESLGGSGIKTIDLACFSRELAYASSGVFSSFTVNVLGLTPILLYGSEELKKRVCQDFVSHFGLFSYCMTEPDTGTNITQARTQAKKVPGGYIINGKKHFITNANFSQHLTVFASLDKGDSQTNLTAFYIPASTKGVSRGKPLKKLGQRDSNTGELYFDSVFVPEENRIGGEGQGLKIAMHCLQRSKTMIAAAGVGVCQRAFDLASDYLETRKIYPKPLLSFQTIQNQLAQLETQASAAWLLTCQAANFWENGLNIRDFALKEASMAKMFSTDVAVHYVSEVLELFGGYGFTQEFEIERLYRDVRLLEIYEGATLVQQILISKELFPQMTVRPAIEEKKAA